MWDIFFFFTVNYNVGYVRIVTDQYAFQHYSPVLFYWNFSQWWLMKLSSGPLLCSSPAEHAVVNVMGCNRRNKLPNFCWCLPECSKHLEPSVWLGALIPTGIAGFIHWLLCIWWKKEVLKECTANRPWDLRPLFCFRAFFGPWGVKK